jgi:branched-chain amino acid transport system permease protein
MAALAGLLAECLVFRRFVGNELGGMITAIALAITIQGAASLLFTVDQQSVARPITGAFEVGGALLAKDQLFVAAAALLVVGLLHLLIHRTRLGLTMKAVAEDPDVARIYGVAPSLVMPIGFALGCLLAGIAGALVAPLYTIHPYMGEVAILKSFIVVVLGGLGSLRGAMLAAIFLGVTEALVSVWASATLATLVAFALVMVILVVRPAGIGGRS